MQSNRQQVLDKYKKILERRIRGMVHFNDVFSDREVDFDAELTVIFRNLAQFSNLMFPIGKNPFFGDYGVVLLNELLEEEKRIINHIKQSSKKRIYRHLEARLHEAVLSVINCAPRNDETTMDGKNGEDFHLAITDHGLEVYAVPVERLQALETRNRILALYKVPNESLQTTDGSREQFRSSIITNSRYFLESLEPIFQYENVEELLKAKKDGSHPQIIPTQEKIAQLAFVDKFGNVRISISNNIDFMKSFSSTALGEKVQIKIGNAQSITAYYVNALKDIPIGELGIYQNVADTSNEHCQACYWEIVRKSDMPNSELEPAVKILEKLNPKYFEEEIFVSPH